MLYKFVLRPYQIRAKYRRYPNVYMSNQFTLWKGDMVEVEKNVQNNVTRYWHYAELAVTTGNKYDVYLKFNGPIPMFLILSTKALQDFVKLQPTKIDREASYINRLFGKIFPKSFSHELSGDNWNTRRNTAMKTLGINFASKYIPLLVESIDACVSSWKPGDTVNFTEEFSKSQFVFTGKTLFGNDFTLTSVDYSYLNKNGELETLNMHQIFVRLIVDVYMDYLHPLGTIFPFLNDYSLFPPYSRTYRNIKELERGLKEFLSHTKDDQNSYYAKIKNLNLFTEEEMVQDLILLLFTGTDTNSHTTASLMYYLGKHPEVKEKCRQEYTKAGIINAQGLQKEKLTMKELEQCEYAEYVIKETMRLEHVGAETVGYAAYENVEICGVPIPKGSILSISLFGMHYNPEEWHEPLKFIPERFDPESEYYTSPSTGKSRNSLSFVPFSVGKRA